MKKRIICILLAAVAALSLLSCGSKPTGETLKVAALKGPTAIGLIGLMDKSEQEKTLNGYDFTLAGAPDEITGGIINGDYDIACVPTNLAATLYNKTNGAVQVVALVTKGVLYVVTTRDDIHSVADLADKTVWSSAKGSATEYAFNYILEKNGILNDVTVEFASEHAEVAAKLSAGDADIAVLPQPFVTAALAQNADLSVALDLTAEWDAASGGTSSLVMSAVIAQKSFIESKPEALKVFLDEYKDSVAYVTDAANIDAVAQYTVDLGIIANANIAKNAIPQCNIAWITGDDMVTAASGYFEALYVQNPQAVGGALPDDGIFYLAK